jgi:regulator of cell morphogenesis and NO signaling
MTTLTLADVAANLGAIRILERYGLDYCCGGKQPFEQACLAKGLAPDRVMLEIEQANAANVTNRDWQTAPLDDLVRHILATHHAYLWTELPALGTRMDKVLSVHGARHPQIFPPMAEVFAAFRAELEMHMRKEEKILFPFLEQYGRAETGNRPLPPVPFGSVANPIAVMEHEHTSSGDAIAAIRALTGNFELPANRCATVRALYEGLQALESDLHVHVHLENNILFPRAIALEARHAERL